MGCRSAASWAPAAVKALGVSHGAGEISWGEHMHILVILSGLSGRGRVLCSANFGRGTSGSSSGT